MNMNINVDGEIMQELRQIATLKNFSLEEAVQVVLARYAHRAKKEIERVYKAADRAIK